jgi:enoyl-CoA hydratase/carnithine racemase
VGVGKLDLPHSTYAEKGPTMDTRVGNNIGYEHVQVSAAAGIATITMNRPERRNALSEAHMRELIAALRAAGDQPDVRAVILGANGSVFCSGHDFADMINRDIDGMRQLLATAITATRRLTKSAISAGNRSLWPSAQRYSIVTFRPST